MKSKPSLLTPILRSDTQGKLLAVLYGHPEQSFTLTELAKHADVSVPTIMRDIDRLVEAEYLIDERIGRARQIRVNTEHPLFTPLWQILMSGYGPVTILPSMLAPVKGIEDGYLFGSWAARYMGEPGASPDDIDVLVVGEVDYGELYEVARKATEVFGREVSIQAVSRDRWDRAADGFVKTIQSRPLITLDLENTCSVSGNKAVPK